MAKPYCNISGCVKEFVHYHCPTCLKGFEYLRHARVHGGENERDGSLGWFASPDDGPHPKILVGLPQLCKWSIMVDVRKLRGGQVKLKSVVRQCEYAEGHEPSKWSKSGHYFGSNAPKNAKAFLPGETQATPPPTPEFIERVTVKLCPDCNEEFTDEEPLEVEPKYECSCGNEFLKSDGNNEGPQCPDCYKFAAKLTDEAHVDCGGNLEEADEEERFVLEGYDEKFETVEDAIEFAKKESEKAGWGSLWIDFMAFSKAHFETQTRDAGAR